VTEIHTERLLLRPMRPSDVDDLFAVFGNPEVMKYWSTRPHEDRSITAALIKGTIAASAETTAEFAIEHQGRVIGKAGFWQMPEIGYLLHPDYWRQGFGAEALTALMDYGFTQRGLDRITADVDPDNLASLALLKKLGFVETGREKNTLRIGDNWYDSVYLECLPF
jgi:RimJ/RimL family protein N-acetyltransferase